MTPAQYAEKHGIPRSTVMKQLRAGTLPAKQRGNGRWDIADGAAPSGPGDLPALDLARLKAEKTEAEIVKLRQGAAQWAADYEAKFWTDMQEAAAWAQAPLTAAIARCGLDDGQRLALHQAFRQVTKRIRSRSKMRARRPAHR